MILVLSVGYADAIKAQAANAYPCEACGLLTGTRTASHAVVERLWTAANVAADPRAAFDLDPNTRFAAEKHSRATGRLVLGHWHSHPNGRDHPSARDLASAFEPNLIWVIAVLAGANRPSLRAFALNPAADGFDPVEIRTQVPDP